MQTRKVYIGTIISYLIIFLLPLTINILMLWEISKSVQENICESVLVNLEHTKDELDEDFQEINEIVAKLTGNSKIRYLAAKMSDGSVKNELSTINQAQEYISTLNVQSLMDEYYVYFHNPKLMLSTARIYLNWDSSQAFFCYNGMEWDEWEALIGNTYNQNFFPETITLQSRKIQDMFLYVQSMFLGKDSKGTFVFPIRSSAVKERMRDAYVPAAGWGYVVDENEQTILSIPSDSGLFIKVDRDLVTGEAVKRTVLDEKKVFVIHSHSEYTGLTYVAVIMDDYITKEIKDARRGQVFLLAGVLLLGGCVILLVSWHKGRRIVGILELVKKPLEKDGSMLLQMDAMEYISQSVQDLIEKNKNLQQDIVNQKPVMRELLIERLLTGTGSGDPVKMRQSLEKYAVGIHGVGMQVFLFSIMEPIASGSVIETGQSVIYKQVLMRNLEDKFGEYAHLCNMGADTLAMLLVLKDDQGTQVEELSALCKKYREEYGVNLRIAGSEVCTDWKDVSRLYDHVCEIMDYVAETDSKVLMYDVYQGKKEYYYYPITAEERLINAVRTGNKELVHEQLHNIFSMNVLEKNLSPTMMHFLINNLQCTILKIQHGMENVSPDEDQLNRELELLNGEKDLLGCFQHINGIFNVLCEKVSQSKSNEKNQAKADLAAYVEKNYSDPNMSLTMIANDFGYVSSYFSRLFKELFNMNFTSYLEQVRISHACELLKTDMGMEQVAGKTGYNSVNVFRTAFKRIKGMAPNDFRKRKDE